MANTTLSPNMSMPVPTVSVDPGPDWATNINSCLSILDGHTHASGSGVPITPSGININSDLTFANNNATNARSIRYYSQSAALALTTDVGCTYVAGVDLYYNDGNGNQIRITQSGSLAGAAGTITGLPSGTASASYSVGTFTFQGATLTPATMAVGPLVVGNAVASSKTVTIAPNAAIASNYNFTLPAALPGALNYMTLDASGNVSYNTSGVTGSGAVVLATSPTFSGTAAGTIGGATFTPTITWSHTPSSIVQSWVYHRINNIVFVNGSINAVGNVSGTQLTAVTAPIASTSITASLGGTMTFGLFLAASVSQMILGGTFDSSGATVFSGTNPSVSSSAVGYWTIQYAYPIT